MTTSCCASSEIPMGGTKAKSDEKTPPVVNLAKDLSHPLEPLTAEEIAIAATAVKAEQSEATGLRFEMIELVEPLKQDVKTQPDGLLNKRQASASVYKLGTIGVWSYVVDLASKTIVSSHHEPKARPMIQLEEFMEIENAVKSDPTFIKGCERRGITNMDLVCVDPWSAGSFDVPGEEDKHLSHAFCWLRTSEFDNLYAHPIEGLYAVVDIKAQSVIRVDDFAKEDKDIVPVPMTNCNYESEFLPAPRDDLKPINVVQPEGVSFQMKGNKLEKWHEWSMVVGFNAREGLTLHDIKFGGRPVLYRASIAEMVVPYGSPTGSHYRKNVCMLIEEAQLLRSYLFCTDSFVILIMFRCLTSANMD